MTSARLRREAGLLPGFSARCSASSPAPGRCIRSDSCSLSASTPRPRSACSGFRQRRATKECPVEALGLIADRLELEGGFWRIVGDLNDNLVNFGFVVVGIFIASWSISAFVYRIKGYDRRPAEHS